MKHEHVRDKHVLHIALRFGGATFIAIVPHWTATIVEFVQNSVLKLNTT